MKETIIITSLKGNELLKSLSLAKVSTFNIRIFNTADLCKEVLLRSGMEIKETISSFRQQCIIYSLLPQVAYFKDCTFADAKDVSLALDLARKLIRNNEEEKMEEIFSQGEFTEKNKAILEVYHLYRNYLKENQLLDAISFINYTKNHALKLEADCVLLEETPFSPLEEELVYCLSDGNCQVRKIKDVFNLEEKELKNVTYDNGYGTINELEHILSYIAENRIPFDQCVVASVDPSGITHFNTLKDLYGLPVSFMAGLPFTLSSISKLLTLIRKWSEGYYATDGLRELLEAPEFNRALLQEKLGLEDKRWNDFVKTAGNLKLSLFTDNEEKVSNYKTVTHYLNNEIELFKEELQKGLGYLLQTYTVIREELRHLDTVAIRTAVETLNEYQNNVDQSSVMDVFDDLQSKNICKENSSFSRLLFTDLNGALSTVRKHLFICGLSAKNFPGSPKENYLLLDSDLELFKEDVPSSDKTVEKKKKLLMDVIELATQLNSQIHISYAGYSLSDLKEENPSSMVFEIFTKQYGPKATMDDLQNEINSQHRYFEAPLSKVRALGQGYMNSDVLSGTPYEETLSEDLVYHGVLSPSSAEKFFECPRQFYLKYVLKIKEPEEDNPFVALPANDEGTLIHKCMEDYGKHPKWTKEQFEKNAMKQLENYFKKRIPLHDKDRDIITRNYRDMVLAGYRTDPHKEIYGSEKYLGPFTHSESGLQFGGIADRIEYNPEDDTYQIIDYKTYRNIRNQENDIETCLQVVIYCWLLENTEGKKVSGAEYRYLRNVRQIHCVYNEGMIDNMNRKLNEISEAFKTGVFSCKTENCRYCRYAAICGKDKGGQK